VTPEVMIMALKNRYDFVLVFDVKDGNPNGDPDAGNQPRVDPETGHGLVTDVCLKRKLRNYVLLSREGKSRFDVYVKEKAVLAQQHARAYESLKLEKTKEKKKASDGEDVEKARDWMCKTFFDVRAFGAVMSLKEANAGQVRGPVQLTFARSVDPVVALEHAITRVAVATTKESEEQGGDNRTMGRKSTIPYGLYVGYGFVNPMLARQTGFDEADLAVLWEALGRMFEHDRSAARGLMSLRRVIAFEHESELGNASAHRLFELVKIARRDSTRPAREFADYEVRVAEPPKGVKIQEPVST
jgi:CRISPR-associated protein Csd2